MRTKKPRSGAENRSERLMFTLPKPLAAELAKYASVFRGGNKSGFVADAIRSYIAHFQRRRHTAQLRQGYALAAEQGRAVAGEWEAIDAETWAMLDALAHKHKKS